jgi:hypothetical protein
MVKKDNLKKLYISLLVLFVLWLVIFFVGLNSNCRTVTASGVHWLSCSELSFSMNLFYGVLSTLTILGTAVIIILLIMRLSFKQ